MCSPGGVGPNAFQWLRMTSQEDRGPHVGNTCSGGHCLPTKSPELKDKGKAATQAGEQVRLWFKVSFIQVVRKEELAQKRGFRVHPSIPPRSGRARRSQQPKETHRRPGHWSAGRGRPGRLDWPPGSTARGVGRTEGGGAALPADSPPPPAAALSLPPCPAPLPPFSWFGFKP